MRRIAVILAILILLSAASVSAIGYAAANGGFSGSAAVCNSSGMYLIGYSGSDLHIQRIAPDAFSDDVTLAYPVSSAAVYGDHAVALCDDIQEEQLILYHCEIGTGVIESYYIPYPYGYHRGFYTDGSVILIQDDDRPSLIRRFSVTGSLKESFDFQGSSVSFIPGYQSGLYILCDGMLYRYAQGGYQAIGGASLVAPAAFIADNVVADSSGALYRVSGSQCQIMLQTGISGGFPAAAMMNGSVYVADGCTVYCCDAASGRRTDYYAADDPVALLYAAGGLLMAASDGAAPAVMRIDPSDFIPCPAEQPENPGPSPITSSVYRIDSSLYRITRIPAATTFAQLKANIRCEGYSVQLYRGGKAITSGSVGTAMTLVFSGSDTYTYELSVIGDITGEGNVNSRDVGELMDYFLGNIRFDGVYTASADVSDDGRVDMLDLAVLCRSGL